MAKGRKLTTSRSERFLGSFDYNQNSGTVNGESELREDEIWSMVDDTVNGDYHSGNGDWSSRVSTESNGSFSSYTRRPAPPRTEHHRRRQIGGLSLAFDDSSNSPSPRIVHQFRSQDSPSQSPRGRQMATSAPVNVPDWSKIYRVNSIESLPDSDDLNDNDSELVPPHEYLARCRRMAANSVFEGVGRTLKGRDLSRVRDAVWSQTREKGRDFFSRLKMDEHLKNLFSRFQEQFGSGPGLGPGSGTCLTKIDGITPPFIKSLYKAAASLYRSDPWRRLRPSHLLGVKVGKDIDWHGRKQPFPCIQFIGGDGGDVAIYMFRSEDDAKKMTSPRETIRAPNVELLRITYEIESQMFPLHKKMIQSLSLEVSGENRYPVFDVARCCPSGEVRFRNLTIEELRFVYGALRGVCLVHNLLEQDFGSGRKYDRVTMFKPFIETVDVQWPLGMVKGNDLVAVTLSYPPNRGYEENTGSGRSMPVEDPDSMEEDT